MTFFATPAGRWLVLLALMVAVAGASYVHGLTHEKGTVAVEHLKDEQAFTKRLLEKNAAERALHGVIAEELQHDADAAREERDAFEKELANAPRETLVACNDTGSAPSAGEVATGSIEVHPAVARFTVFACRLWNRALAAGATAAERAGWLARDDPCTDSPTSP